jgi:bifunctional DNase/RNase
VLSVDARPSDSIAVALRTEASLYVNEELLQSPPESPAIREAPDDEPGPPSEEPSSPLTEEQKAEQLRRFLENLDPEDFGKFQR